MVSYIMHRMYIHIYKYSHLENRVNLDLVLLDNIKNLSFYAQNRRDIFPFNFYLIFGVEKRYISMYAKFQCNIVQLLFIYALHMLTNTRKT